MRARGSSSCYKSVWEDISTLDWGWLPLCIVVVLLVWFPFLLFGQSDNPARAVVEQSEAAFREGVQNEDVGMTMVIIDPDGAHERGLRYVIEYGAGEEGNKTLVRFDHPKKIQGVAVLTLEDPEGDKQYLYLKSVKKSTKVAVTERKDMFFGTDYSIGDLRLENMRLWAYRDLVEETLTFSAEYGGETIRAQRLEAVPVEGADAYYTRRVLWYDSARHVLLKEEMYNAEGLWKTRTRWEFVSFPLSSGRAVLRARFEEMRDQRGSRTVIEATRREFNQTLPRDLFTTRELDRGR